MFDNRTIYNATATDLPLADVFSRIQSSIAFALVPALHITVMLGGLIMNVCMVHLGWRRCGFSDARSRFDYFFMMVGLCDIGTLSMTPFWVAQTLAEDWTFGYVGCKTMKGIITFCVQYGILIIVYIGIESYTKVVLGRRTLSFLSWVRGERAHRAVPMLALTIPPTMSALVDIYNYRTIDVGQITLCADTSSPTERFITLWVRITVFFIAPCFILAFCYGSIFLKVRRHVGNVSPRLGRQRRPIKQCNILPLLMVAVFVGCWTPWIVISIYYASSRTEVHNQLKLFVMTNVSLAAGNMYCIATPALYLSTRLNRSFRRVDSGTL